MRQKLRFTAVLVVLVIILGTASYREQGKRQKLSFPESLDLVVVTVDGKPVTLREMAFYIASTGKPGPVLIDIPKDIQTAAGPAEYPSNIQIRGYKPNESVHIGQLKKAYKLLRTAKKPLILAGGGINIAHANDKLLALAEKMQM